MPYVKDGVLQGINYIRENASAEYQSRIPIITDDTDISVLSTPILEYADVRNEFVNSLISRIGYTQFLTKYYNNPLQVLEGDNIPLGYAGQEIYTNPAKGRKFDVDDFAGLLQKYETDVKVQYLPLNMDLQYPVTISRNQLRTAFVSWDDLEAFINQLSNSLYNGAYIDEYRFTKGIVSSAYKNNQAIIQQISAPTTEALAKQFVKVARRLFLDYKAPSSQFNAWTKCGGDGKPIITWTNPDDVVMVIRNDVSAELDVEVLAKAMNIDKTTLLGNIITVDNFDMYSDEGVKVFDGSAIQGIICDKAWFRIKKQDMYLDDFKNANNRTWQYYLNLTKMYQFSLFANGVILATSLPA